MFTAQVCKQSQEPEDLVMKKKDKLLGLVEGKPHTNTHNF